MSRFLFRPFCAGLAAAFVSCSAFAAKPIPVALLSVATEEATLELATLESRRPVATPVPAPYPESVLKKLSGDSLRVATAVNARVARANAKAAAVLAQEDREKRETRENEALHAFSLSELGKAVSKAPGFFRYEAGRTEEMVLLRVGEDGYFEAPESARLVRLHFGVPRKSASAAEVPGTSNAPVSLSMTVTMKVESASGETLQTETFDQSASFANSDELLGAAYAVAVENLVKAATENAVGKMTTMR